MIAFLKRLFAPRGNLLTADIIAELEITILSTGECKAGISKFHDNQEQHVAQAIINGGIQHLVSFARERGISINWDILKQMYPPQPQGGQRG